MPPSLGRDRTAYPAGVEPTTLRTVAAPVVVSLEEKRSVFECWLRPVDDETAARAVVEEARTTHWDARHHCSAFVLGPGGTTVRSNDDGEPAGTAGMPMLEVLTGAGLTDVVAVVTRWFGGVLLGAVLVVLAVLAGFAVLASEMPRMAAWPAAALAILHGLHLAWRELRRPRSRFVFAGQDAPVEVDGRTVRDASVTWRGPLAFVRWRGEDGRRRYLAWWPDTLPAGSRRELRLAAPVRRAARKAASVAP